MRLPIRLTRAHGISLLTVLAGFLVFAPAAEAHQVDVAPSAPLAYPVEVALCVLQNCVSLYCAGADYTGGIFIDALGKGVFVGVQLTSGVGPYAGVTSPWC